MTAGDPVGTDVVVLLTARARAARSTSRLAVQRSRTLVCARRAVRNDDLMVTRCAWCGRFCFDGEWATPLDAGLFGGFPTARTTHGICPDCLAGLAAAGKSAPVER